MNQIALMRLATIDVALLSSLVTRSVSEGRAIPQNPSLTRRVVIKATSRYASGCENSLQTIQFSAQKISIAHQQN